MEGIISWNVPNWITVLLMVAVGGLVLGTISKAIQAKSAQES